MRIGVLTFHKPINYGAFLQAFSLSERLKREFPNDEVEIIDYIAPREYHKRYLNILRDVKYGGIRAGILSAKKFFVFRKSQKHLKLSKRFICTNHLETLFSFIKENYDCLVIGSDAIFNWNQTDFPTAFIPCYNFGIPVLTYAASVHGLDYYNVENQKTELCGKAFQKMKFIGVRDACTAAFVKHCDPDAEPVFCCDPTLFIDRDKIREMAGDYLQRLGKKYNFAPEKKYIVFMAPDSELLKCVSQRYGEEYTILSLFVNSEYADAFLYDLDPFEWAMLLRGAAATITSYFHGTLLSLVQGTPAVVLDYSGYDDRYEGKLCDLMKTRFQLPEFYFEKQFATACPDYSAFYDLFERMLAGTYTETIQHKVELLQKSYDAFLKVMLYYKQELDEGRQCT